MTIKLLSPLLRDIPERDVKETLNILSSVSNGFSSSVTRSVVADQISSVFPEIVKRWARDTRDWSIGAAVVVGAAYPHSRQGFIELLEQRDLVGERQAEVLAAMITDQKSSNSPYWLWELSDRRCQADWNVLACKFLYVRLYRGRPFETAQRGALSQVG